MSKIARFAGDLLAFAINATGTNRTVFGDVTQSDTLDDNVNADYLLGWEIVTPSEVPTKEDFNALGFTLGQMLAYLHQVGVPEWQTDQEFHIGSFTNKSGILYVSEINTNTGNDPATDDGTNWSIFNDSSIIQSTITPTGDTNVTLTDREASSDLLVLVDGAWTTGHQIIVPDESRRFFVDNTAGTYDAAIKTAAGASVTVGAGKSKQVISDGVDVIELNPITPEQILPISASVGASALTVSCSSERLDFRSTTLGSGSVSSLDIPSPISVVVSSGSTLGAVNGVQSRIAIVAIAVGSVVELGVVNIAGGNNLDESTLITTVAIGGGGADSANVFYSTLARVNVPFRVVGYVESTQATAGTWVTAPSTIQGVGGNAMTAMSSIGYGQTWQDVKASRTSGVTYYNTTGKPILVSIEGDNSGSGTSTLVVNGVTAAQMFTNSASTAPFFSAIVPPGASYVGTIAVGILLWAELR